MIASTTEKIKSGSSSGKLKMSVSSSFINIYFIGVVMNEFGRCPRLTICMCKVLVVPQGHEREVFVY